MKVITSMPNKIKSSEIIHGTSTSNLTLENILNKGNLVANFILGNNSASITISNLDIIRDGGIYEVYGNLQGATLFDAIVVVNGNLSSANRHETIFNLSTGNTTFYLGTNEPFVYLGKAAPSALSNFKATIYRRSENRIYIEVEADVYSGTTQLKFIEGCIITMATTNITSLSFSGIGGGIFEIGSCVKVYKR